MNIEQKKQAIITLLEYSLLFTPQDKILILKSLAQLTEEEINGLGKILAVEHQNRDKLDEKMLETLFKDLEKYIEE